MSRVSDTETDVRSVRALVSVSCLVHKTGSTLLTKRINLFHTGCKLVVVVVVCFVRVLQKALAGLQESFEFWSLSLSDIFSFILKLWQKNSM